MLRNYAYMRVKVISTIVALLCFAMSSAQATDCGTDCRSKCGGDIGLVLVPALSGNCIVICEGEKAMACGIKWRIPPVEEAIQSVFKGVCSTPFEGFVAPVLAECSNWNGRLDNLEKIDQAKKLLLERNLLKPEDFTGVEIRWCPLHGPTNGITPRPNLVYLNANLITESVSKRAAVLGHEMVHVKQFRDKGDTDFRCEYGRALLDCGYCQDERHPLEKEAYNFEAKVRYTLSFSNPPVSEASDCATRQTGGDQGYTEGRAWVDADGNGCSDFCRVVGTPSNQQVRCMLTPRGTSSGYKDVLSQNLDWGWPEYRYWIDVDSDRRSDFCRIVGNPGAFEMWCTPMKGEVFIEPIKFPGTIDRGWWWSGFWLDVDSNGFRDYCRSIGSGDNPIRECLLSNGHQFIGKRTIP